MPTADLETLATTIGAEGLAHDSKTQDLLKGIRDGIGSLLALAKGKGPAEPEPKADDDEGDGGGDEEEQDDARPGYQPMDKGGEGVEFVDATAFVQEVDRRLQGLEKASKGDRKLLREVVEQLKAAQEQNRALAAALGETLVPLAKAVADTRIAVGGHTARQDVVQTNRSGMRQILEQPPVVIPAEMTQVRLAKALQGRIIDEDTFRHFRKTGKFDIDEAKNAEITKKVLEHSTAAA